MFLHKNSVQYQENTGIMCNRLCNSERSKDLPPQSFPTGLGKQRATAPKAPSAHSEVTSEVRYVSSQTLWKVVQPFVWLLMASWAQLWMSI